MRMLRWHYRSKHQSLIAVSNRQFYENKLFIVPSPYTAEAGMGLRCESVGISVRRIGDSVADLSEPASALNRRGPVSAKCSRQSRSLCLQAERQSRKGIRCGEALKGKCGWEGLQSRHRLGEIDIRNRPEGTSLSVVQLYARERSTRAASSRLSRTYPPFKWRILTRAVISRTIRPMVTAPAFTRVSRSGRHGCGYGSYRSPLTGASLGSICRRRAAELRPLRVTR